VGSRDEKVKEGWGLEWAERPAGRMRGGGEESRGGRGSGVRWNRRWGGQRSGVCDSGGWEKN